MERSSVHLLLGELLHLCQRIEWTMKYMVEQACIEVEFKSLEELKHPKPLEFHWLDNKDCLGGVVYEYLDKYYGMPVDDFTDGEFIKIQNKFSFVDANNPEGTKENYERREAELKELVETRNFLVHRFGLEFNLQNEENCKSAFEYLQKAKEIIVKHAKIIGNERNHLESMKQMCASLMLAPSFFSSFDSKRLTQQLYSNVGMLNTYNFSDMGNKNIFDFTDNQEVIDAILYGVEDKSPAYYTDIPKMTRLAHLECLANMTGNRNFIEAVEKQQRLIRIWGWENEIFIKN